MKKESHSLDHARKWLCLRMTDGMTGAKALSLIDRFGGIDPLFDASYRDLMQVEKITEPIARTLAGKQAMSEADEQCTRALELGVHIMTYADQDYPVGLRMLHNPPLVLYIRGEIASTDDPAFAIVGSRNATPYGQKVAENFSARLAEYAITVVSGMAIGIDTASHRGALSRKGRTIAVLGTGIDVVYPRQNRRLADTIASNGAMVTEYPFGTQPLHYNFPARNRIIAGLSRGVIVVEAAEKSGALITATIALDEGRDVFAVPGNITSPLSAGSNSLLVDGAIPVTEAGQIVRTLPEIYRHRYTEIESSDHPDSTAELDERQAIVYQYLLNNEARHIDQMARSLKVEPSSLAGILLDLELKNLVKELPGKRFIRI
ncbi:DNA-processing protein DprA [Acidobacteriota bacterium]